jgi:ribosomal protein S3
MNIKREETIRKLNYNPMLRALLKGKANLDKKNIRDSSTRTVRGLSISVKGRLRGVRRSRKLELIEKGVSANTLGKEHKFMQVPISTK